MCGSVFSLCYFSSNIVLPYRKYVLSTISSSSYNYLFLRMSLSSSPAPVANSDKTKHWQLFAVGKDDICLTPSGAAYWLKSEHRVVASLSQDSEILLL